jgi:TatD DNase family protein
LHEWPDVIDTHIHLDSTRYADARALSRRCLERGVKAVVVPGVSGSSNLAALELAARFPGLVYAAAGLHPELPEMNQPDIDLLLDTVRRYRSSICAIGEVGLPYYGPSAAAPGRVSLAYELLERCAQAAVELDLPLILHAPHQTAAVALRILTNAGVRRAVFHWHKSDQAVTRSILDAGFLVSLTPEVSWRDRDRALARFAPLDHIVVETDGPYAHDRVFPGMLTEPWMVSAAIAAIAAVKGLAHDEVAAATTANARALFGLNPIETATQ